MAGGASPARPQREQLLKTGGVRVGARACVWDEPEATARYACECVRVRVRGAENESAGV